MMRDKNDGAQCVICAGCVVYRFRDAMPEILLIRQKNCGPRWCIPKGHKEEDERIIDCAVRETWEETGVACVPDFKLNHVDVTTRHERKRVYAYLARCVGDDEPNPIMKHEISDVRWWPIDSLPPIYDYQKPIIEHAVLILTSQMQQDSYM